MKHVLRDLNHNQRGAAGTLAIALIVAALFYIPWRIESSGDIRWAPFYRNPVIGQTIRLDDDSLRTRFVRLKGRPIWWLYGLQLVAIGGIGAGVVHALRDREDEPT